MTFIRWFKDLTIKDISLVGGKNASLGEMYSKLLSKGVPVPNGFAITAEAYWKFIRDNKLDARIKATLKGLNVKNVRALNKAGSKVRGMILSAEFSEEMKQEVVKAYRQLSAAKTTANPTQPPLSKGRRRSYPLLSKEGLGVVAEGIGVAVRSSATAEDLPDASFAGQQESYLNVRGVDELLLACKKCIASLFTDRAISYREAKGFDHLAVALSIGVQQMVRSDMAVSGVMFTLDTESGFDGVVLINASYGLGEYVVKGRVTPDQFFVFKEGLRHGYASIMSRKLGTKEVKLVYANARPLPLPSPLRRRGSGFPSSTEEGNEGRSRQGGTKQIKVPVSEQNKFCLSDEEVVKLASWGMQIEKHYGRPMDIEWAKDGVTGKLFIVQARSETVQSRIPTTHAETYRLLKKGKILVEGTSVGQRIGQGKVRIIDSPTQMKQFKPGEVLVTRITDPDWEPVMRIASAIITEQGGKTSHAAIVSRELGIPCIVGAVKARQTLKQGSEVTVSCAEGEVGYIYAGRLPFEMTQLEMKAVKPLRTKILMNVADPDRAFFLTHLPSDGVGLAREEFIFTNFIKIHPLALIHFNQLTDAGVKAKINALTIGYKDKTKYLVDKLAEGMAFIAAAFYPRPVTLRFSDFKSNEYATLLGGHDFEPNEENPMLGWRGASRYYDKKFKPAFGLECAAVKKVRTEWGLKNVELMVPFCRTVEEGEKVLATMKEFGLEKGKDGLKVLVMCEIPSNVLLAKDFSRIFDGFSIGSNDLTQLTLGVDRDSALVSHVYNEQNAAVKKLIRDVIHTAHENNRTVGICGQAPSDYPEFAEFLVQEGIDSISLNPDAIIKTRERIAAMEKKIGVKRAPRVGSLASKAVTVLGLIGVISMLVGYTCQTINTQAVVEDTKSTIALEVAKAKANVRREFEAEKAREKSEEKITYSEDSFVKFSVQLPVAWSVTHRSNEIFFGKNVSEFGPTFSVYVGKPIVSSEEYIMIDASTTTAWNGLSIRRFSHEIVYESGGVLQILVEVYPKKYRRGNDIVILKGDQSKFDEIFNSIQDFEIKK